MAQRVEDLHGFQVLAGRSRVFFLSQLNAAELIAATGDVSAAVDEVTAACVYHLNEEISSFLLALEFLNQRWDQGFQALGAFCQLRLTAIMGIWHDEVSRVLQVPTEPQSTEMRRQLQTVERRFLRNAYFELFREPSPATPDESWPARYQRIFGMEMPLAGKRRQMIDELLRIANGLRIDGERKVTRALLHKAVLDDDTDDALGDYQRGGGSSKAIRTMDLLLERGPESLVTELRKQGRLIRPKM